MGYLDFICLEANARLVLTDSGGVQEETTALGVACVTLRENTERPITVTEGTNHVVGTDHEQVLATACALIENGIEPRCPSLWDGHAGDRAAAAIVGTDPATHPRPTELPGGPGD